MKKNTNKNLIIIASILIFIAAVAGVFFIKNKQSNEVSNENIRVTVRKASFGAVVNVTLSEEGKKAYKGAEKYQVQYEAKPVTQKEEIGKPTTIFPVRKVNDKVVVSLLNKENKEIYSIPLTLQKEETK